MSFTSACLFPNLAELSSDAGGDAASTTEGGGEAGEAGDAGRFCDQTPHTFCDDFDHGPLTDLWTLSTDPQVEMTIVTSVWNSPPSSFFSRVDNTTTNVYAWLIKSFAGPMSEAKMAFDMTKLVATTAQSSLGNGFFSTAIHVAAGLDCNLILVNDGTTTNVQWQAGSENHFFALSPNPDLTRWSRIGIDITGGSSATAATITVNGTKAVNDPMFDSLMATCGFGDTVFFGVGMYYAIAPCEAYYDDVTYDQK